MSNLTWLLAFATKCEIRIKNCFLRFSKSFAGAASIVGSGGDSAAVTVVVVDGLVPPVDVVSGELLRLILRISTSL